MKQFITVLIIVGSTLAVPLEQQLPREDVDAIELEQNKNAKYEFESDIEDHINDLSMKRVEQRDGLNVRGTYEYSDGYLKRTVHYVADQNGYRIVKEDNVPLSGPKVDLNGVASITNKAHGTELKYTVKSVPVKDTRIFE